MDKWEHDETFKKLIKTLQCQFLCCFPVNNIQWQNIPRNLTWEQQEQILKSTCGHERNRWQPINLDYQLNFLNRLIQTLEQNCEEIHDNIYNEYCKIQKLKSQEKNTDYIYKHYVIPDYSKVISMREAKSFVEKGTTGLCTWPASLALTDFLLHHKEEYVQSKKIFELGAGTGFCGMVLMHFKLPSVMALTDGSIECVELMKQNIEQNFYYAKKAGFGFFSLDKYEFKYIGAFHLPWENIKEFKFNEELTPDLILAADVIYDDSLFDDLINAIDFLFEKAEKEAKMFLAATVRNEETLEQFLKMVPRSFTVKDCNIIPENEAFLQWDRTTIVRILEITKNLT